ncbi:hypothetical protein PIB30_050753 [Stylosanthes scabra]|uniref:EF-hand domain-containing protein n=1 Tax=Stylosanthes scabra TaxID=79078 RepID=A0ABU6THG2_9FABA|nr:hypothetical protein [Stylosanthes scabra]
MFLEAQVAEFWRKTKYKVDERNVGGLHTLDTGSAVRDGSESSWSYPFPQGFGPCSDFKHVHRMDARVLDDTQIESEARIGEGEKENFVLCTGVRVEVSGLEGGRAEDSVSESPVIEGVGLVLPAVGCVRVDDSISVSPFNKKAPEIDGVSTDADSETEEEWSDERLYQINRAAATGNLPCRGDKVSVNVVDGITGKIGRIDSGCVSAREDVNAEEEIKHSGEKLYLINNNMVERGQISADLVGRGAEKTLNDEDAVSWEEEILAEATESKRVWAKGGISFDSSDEEEVLARLMDRKLDGKKRVDLRPKKQRQLRKPLCIQGRTLATRTLRILIRHWQIRIKEGFFSILSFCLNHHLLSIFSSPNCSNSEALKNNLESVVESNGVKLCKEDVIIVMERLGMNVECDDGVEELGVKKIVELFEEDNSSNNNSDDAKFGEEVKEAFDVFDRNKDGFIDSRELKRVLSCLGLEKDVLECQKMINASDQNGDGLIDQNEFVRILEQSIG